MTLAEDAGGHGKGSPTVAFAGRSPRWTAGSTTGVTFMTGMRPTMAPHFRFGSGDASRALLRLDGGHDGPARPPRSRAVWIAVLVALGCVAVVAAALVLRDEGAAPSRTDRGRR